MVQGEHGDKHIPTSIVDVVQKFKDVQVPLVYESLLFPWAFFTGMKKPLITGMKDSTIPGQHPYKHDQVLQVIPFRSRSKEWTEYKDIDLTKCWHLFIKVDDEIRKEFILFFVRL